MLKVRLLFTIMLLLILPAGIASAQSAPALLSDEQAYDTQPVLAAAPDGSTWCVWVAWDPAKGDRILARLRHTDGTWDAPETAVADPGACVRPTAACVGETVHLFWTASDEKKVSQVRHCERGKNGWSAPAVFSDPARASQNQDLAVGGGGRLFVIWQQWGGDAASGPRYDIVLRTLAPEGWQGTVILAASGDNWDPAIATSHDGAHTWAAWTGYAKDDYDLFLVPIVGGAPGPVRVVGARGMYDLHPSLAVEPDGAAWVAWDEIHIQGHGGSGRSTITGANLQVDPDADTHKARPHSTTRVARVTAEKIEWIDTEALIPPAPHELAHAALPKVVLDAGGHPWVFYRALRQRGGEGQGQGKRKPRGPGGKVYWWDGFGQSLGKGWSEPFACADSDGALEEMAVAQTAGGIVVAWSTEHRQDQPPIPRKGAVQAEDEDHHGDYEGALGRDGDVCALALASADGAFTVKSAPRAEPTPDRSVPDRVERASAAYETKVGEKTYHLYWGDFHKHSNVSRCSSGNEPGPDDHYRYATDVCRYDFMAMSDHSEHTSPYNWWRLQKLADLYQVPGSFVPLYGYEWSARWPIGHHNVIFRGKPDPILRSNVAGARTTPELWKSLAGVKALTIPHTTADPGMGTDFENHDEEFERVLEIFQAARGSYEHDHCPRQHENARYRGGFYWNALMKGYHLGVICSSDHGWGTAYVAAYAEEDTRESVFDAVWARRCYGSTTYGLVVDLRADGHCMGEQYAGNARPKLEITARSPVALRSVEIISHGTVIFSRGSEKDPIGEKELHLSWQEPEDWKGETWYYVRVIRVDDEMAWTSPVWVTRE